MTWISDSRRHGKQINRCTAVSERRLSARFIIRQPLKRKIWLGLFELISLCRRFRLEIPKWDDAGEAADTGSVPFFWELWRNEPQSTGTHVELTTILLDLNTIYLTEVHCCHSRGKKQVSRYNAKRFLRNIFPLLRDNCTLCENYYTEISQSHGFW